ncbi:MAG: sulfatase, partial [Planctomycetota bacterium]|nr:sulfatase [Planctomycetota bacterium]
MDPRSFLTALLAATASSCGGGGDCGPRSALLITLDTTRYDALGCTGGPPGVSPNLDALAAEGVLYEQARTVCPLTMPAHASIFTGLYPLRHTVHMNSMLALPSSAHTLAERASQRGFQTAAFIAAVVLADDFGLAQGFERYDQPAPPLVQREEIHYDRRPANEVADDAIAWLAERDPERPFLLWTHFFDPHVPHDPPGEFLRAGKGDPYLGAVAFMDHHIGRILAALDEEGLLDETIVVVVADHGEARGDHGESTHGVLAYDSTIRVPLIVRHPDGWRAGERSDEIVSVVDVFPTLVEALELGGPGDVDGVSLHRRRAPPDRGVYYESYYGFFSYGWSPLAGWADARGRYLHSSAPEYYALTDEEERVDLIAEQDELERYRRAIDSIAGRSRLTRDANDTAAAHVLAQLQRLGYTGAAAGADGIP